MSGLRSETQQDRQPKTSDATPVSMGQARPQEHALLGLQRTVGNQAVQRMVQAWSSPPPRTVTPSGRASAAKIWRKIERDKLNVVGEDHQESEPRRDEEKAMLKDRYGFAENQYWTEAQFAYMLPGSNEIKYGDDPMLRMAHHAAMVLSYLTKIAGSIKSWQRPGFPFEHKHSQALGEELEEIDVEFGQFTKFEAAFSGSSNKEAKGKASAIVRILGQGLGGLKAGLAVEPRAYNRDDFSALIEVMAENIDLWKPLLANYLKAAGHEVESTATDKELADLGMGGLIDYQRSFMMFEAAEEAAEKNKRKGVWKIGNTHVRDLQGLEFKHATLTSLEEFESEFDAWKYPAKARAKEFLEQRARHLYNLGVKEIDADLIKKLVEAKDQALLYAIARSELFPESAWKAGAWSAYQKWIVG